MGRYSVWLGNVVLVRSVEGFVGSRVMSANGDGVNDSREASNSRGSREVCRKIGGSKPRLDEINDTESPTLPLARCRCPFDEYVAG